MCCSRIEKTSTLLTMSSTAKSDLLNRLRPICVQLTKEHTRENVAALSHALNGLDKVYMQELQEYVLFPLRIILKHDKQYVGDLYVDIYTCMERVLSHSCVTRWDMFLDIFNTAVLSLSDPTDPSKVSRISEELKLAMVQMLLSLLKSSDFVIIENLFAVSNLPLLGHAVSILLNIADQERSRSLKVAALEFLAELCQEDRQYCTKVKMRLGDTFASFLPGVTITLSRVISRDTHQGQSVVKTAIEVLTKVMRLVLDDKFVKESQVKAKGQGHSPHENKQLQSLVVQRNTDWVKNVSSKLAVIVKQVSKVRGHRSWKVRLALVEWANVLLHHCSLCMDESVPDLLETLVSRIGDEYPCVGVHSRQALETFAASCDSVKCRPLVEILVDNLHSLSLSLPRQMTSADEEEKFGVVQMLAGYLDVLGPHIDRLLMSSAHCHRLLMSLVLVLEMDYSDVKIVEERTAMVGQGTTAIDPASIVQSEILRPRKYFRNFHDKRTYEELQKACQCLGRYGNIQLLVDQVLDIAQSSSAYAPQALLLLNMIISGLVSVTEKECMQTDDVQSRDGLKSVISMLVEEYLSPSNFNLVTKATDDRCLESTLRAITLCESSVSAYNRNIVLTCVVLEGLGTFAMVLGESYLPLLIQTLYPLLEKLGDDSAFISTSAYLALCDTCTACRYRSIDELICENSDYLVNAISLRLRHFHDNQQSPLVLKVMLQYSSQELLPLIDDTIQEILECLDDHHTDQAMLFMGVLHELTRALVRWSVTSEECGRINGGSSGNSGIVRGTIGDSTAVGGTSGDSETVTGTSRDSENDRGRSGDSETDRGTGGMAGIDRSLSEDSETDRRMSRDSENDRGTSGDSETDRGTGGMAGIDRSLSGDSETDRRMSRDSENDRGTSGDSENYRCLSGRVAGIYGGTSEEKSKSRWKVQNGYLLSYVMDYCKQKKISMGDVTDDDIMDEDDIVDETCDENRSKGNIIIPDNISIIKQVMIRCKHLLSSHNARLRLLVLDTLGQACSALCDHTNELLPLLHEVWLPFSARFFDEEKLVVKKAVETLCVMADVSGDFLQQRVVKDVLPSLTSFLDKQAKISVHAGQAYLYTVNCKLQHVILQHLGDLSVTLGLQGRALDQVMSVCVGYLSVRQPKSLQQVSMETCKQLASVGGDGLWLRLCDLYREEECLPPHPVFTRLKFRCQAGCSNEYTANIQRLLSTCDAL